VAEANLGSVYGWGFPSFYGGVLQYIKAYGLAAFMEKCTQHEQLHGPRFKVPRLLKTWLAEGTF
jgi:3-hydroxyacyl-CoA dehydrogenase/enoyl-CoA hydratase/3-hydroxybutyryl-CoA epimerase